MVLSREIQYRNSDAKGGITKMFDIHSNEFISELLKRKEALLEAALAYNAIACQIDQEVVAIDFDHGLGSNEICRIMIKEFAHSSPLIQKYIRTKTLMAGVLGDVRRKDIDAEVQLVKEAHALEELADTDTKEFIDFAKELGLQVGVEVLDPSTGLFRECDFRRVDPAGRSFQAEYVCRPKPNPDPRRDVEEARLKHDLESRRLIIDDPVRLVPYMGEELKAFHWPDEFNCFYRHRHFAGRYGMTPYADGGPCLGRLDCPMFKSVLEGRRGR